MSKVTVIQVVYNNRRFIEPVFSAIFSQTYKDIHVVAVISGNDDQGKELLMEKFPQVEIIDPGYNIGFSKGHNLVFEKYCNPVFNPSPYEVRGRGGVDFFQLVNPDFIMEPDYIERMVKVFDDPKVGAATGKLYQFKDLRFKIEEFRENKILDTTGVTISKSGRARDRGQHEVDHGQYDNQLVVDAVSGAGCMYRASALQAVGLNKIKDLRFRIKENTQPKTEILNLKSEIEYFDEDFHSYWEDVDLAWRMRNAGWRCVFVPGAVGYHGRGAGSSKNGYADVAGFIKHHQSISPRVRQLNYKNHIFMYIKNARRLYLQFFIREFFMFGYILLFEISTLKILPEMFRQWSRMWQKRKMIMRLVSVRRDPAVR